MVLCGLFDNAEWGNGTVNTLNEMGMKTFVLASSVTGGTYESVYDDIENLGNLFGVQDQAEAFSTKLKTRQKAIQDSLSTIKEEKDFALLFITDPNEVSVYGAKDETFFNDLFKMVKLNNVYAETEGDISIEALIETDPEFDAYLTELGELFDQFAVEGKIILPQDSVVYFKG